MRWPKPQVEGDPNSLLIRLTDRHNVYVLLHETKTMGKPTGPEYEAWRLAQAAARGALNAFTRQHAAVGTLKPTYQDIARIGQLQREARDCFDALLRSHRTRLAEAPLPPPRPGESPGA